MKTIRFILLLSLVAMVGGCGAGSTNLQSSGGVSIGGRIQDRVVKIFQEASDNLHLAVTVDEIPANDPAIPCVDQILTDLGVKPGGAITQYKTETIGGAGAYLYIKASRAQQSKGDLQAKCEQLVGRIMIAGAKQAPISGNILR